MGHNPCSHQVWIRITGLPLQAWTVEGITSFLQELGHPLDVLPFGREAGHFQDVTALIATINPNRIPRACSYREGDYSIRVEIRILASRHSQPDYFPPPPPPELGENSLRHTSQQQRNRDSPLNRSGASSPDSNPSEPTIDLSAWSPRSRTVLICTRSLAVFFDGGKILLAHTSSHNSTAKDLVLGRSISGTLPIPHISLQISPCPIPINFPAALWMTRCKDIDKGENSLTTPYTSSCLQHDVKFLDLQLSTRGEAFKPLSLLDTVNSVQLYSTADSNKQAAKSDESPICYQIQAFDFYSNLSKAFLGLSLFSPNPTEQNKNCFDPNPKQPNIQNSLHADPFTYAQNHSSEQLHESLSSGPLSTSLSDCIYLPHQVVDQQTTLHPSLNDNTIQDSRDLSALAPQDSALAEEQLMQPLSENQSLHSPSISSSNQVRFKTKQKMLPTRRSQRLQTKKGLDCPLSSSRTAKTKEKKSLRVTFTFPSHESPLEADAVKSILQASGLQINQEVENMIAEAINQDCATLSAQESRPCTPLHDIIPPRLIPGEDILL